jgi:hypothetical protein
VQWWPPIGANLDRERQGEAVKRISAILRKHVGNGKAAKAEAKEVQSDFGTELCHDSFRRRRKPNQHDRDIWRVRHSPAGLTGRQVFFSLEIDWSSSVTDQSN